MTDAQEQLEAEEIIDVRGNRETAGAEIARRLETLTPGSKITVLCDSGNREQVVETASVFCCEVAESSHEGDDFTLQVAPSSGGA